MEALERDGALFLAYAAAEVAFFAYQEGQESDSGGEGGKDAWRTHMLGQIGEKLTADWFFVVGDIERRLQAINLWPWT